MSGLPWIQNDLRLNTEILVQDSLLIQVMINKEVLYSCQTRGHFTFDKAHEWNNFEFIFLALT